MYFHHTGHPPKNALGTCNIVALRQLTRAAARVELQHFIDTFLDDLAVRNRTEATQCYYRVNLNLLAWYAEREGWPESLKDITATHIRAFIRYLQTSRERWDSEHP